MDSKTTMSQRLAARWLAAAREGYVEDQIMKANSGLRSAAGGIHYRLWDRSGKVDIHDQPILDPAEKKKAADAHKKIEQARKLCADALKDLRGIDLRYSGGMRSAANPLPKAIFREFHTVWKLEHGDKYPRGRLKIKYTGEEEEGTIRFFEIRDGRKTVARGNAEEWGRYVELDLV
jgi:hypothetical protein